jgi:hypothetical protein
MTYIKVPYKQVKAFDRYIKGKQFSENCKWALWMIFISACGSLQEGWNLWRPVSLHSQPKCQMNRICLMVALKGNRDNSVNIVTRLRTGCPGFDFQKGRGLFLFATASRTDLGPIQPPIMGTAAISPRVKRPGREADHSPPSSAEVKNAWSYTSTPPLRLLGVVLS